MTDRGKPATTHCYLPSSSLSTVSEGTASNNVRPRNRRVESAGEAQTHPTTARTTRSTGVSYPSAPSDHRRENDPLAAEASRADSLPSHGSAGGELVQFLGDSWTQSWTSVQAFASTIISGGDAFPKGTRSPQLPPRPRRNSRPDTWGPSPPPPIRAFDDVGVGSLAQRRDALRAAKTASVLESHEGVNGGLDITGRHKRRTSDEMAHIDGEPEEHLAYLHNVDPTDTYAGIILRYKCREDVFRKSNGLWSRDSVQTRKWLIIPVDVCEIKGCPCDPPSWPNTSETDLLAPTPLATEEPISTSKGTQNDFFRPSAGPPSPNVKQGQADDLPWSHVRWVQLDSFRQPVQIVRVSRQALGYFPPRRKKSIRTASPLSTPRQSSDLSSLAPNSTERPHTRRLSSLSSLPQIPGTPISSTSRAGSEAADNRPAWMRRPGGVGSMSRTVRAPGPDKDYLNSWTRKHIPGLNIENLPSMSVMGSDTARFGFGQGTTGIAESPFELGRDASSVSRQGTGLDRAAAAVEHWLRGALAKRPSTPLLRGRPRPPGMSADPDATDLIELADTASEDGKTSHDMDARMQGWMYSGRIDGGSSLKSRAKFNFEGAGAHGKDD
ncbi:LysM domain-containing protein [Pochonia chlamydosporia 170]|uniref:LysM domain-containing protein n=1 Tax=Pochonia chlamydosporia 170 TaxID=1380566 RepID=A0A179G0G1_METCM|nr:LysM domain-containing protein [Pochonia chlamydosporia 170]OAQ71187.1 LysM domain-containing protein [Pochonia chlamydosporia 170]